MSIGWELPIWLPLCLYVSKKNTGWDLFGPIANPHAKVSDPPSTPKSGPWGMIPATEWKFCSICFLSFFCKNACKVWYKNLRIHMVVKNLMVFDLLTSLQGHQFDPRMKILLAFCSAHHPCRFDMGHDHV